MRSSSRLWVSLSVAMFCAALLLSSCDSTPGGPEPDLVAPSVPANLHAVVHGDGTVSLSWSPSFDNVGVAGYNVRRWNHWVCAVSETSWVDLHPPLWVEVEYSVGAYDTNSNESAFSAPLAVTPELALESIMGDWEGQLVRTSPVHEDDLWPQEKILTFAIDSTGVALGSASGLRVWASLGSGSWASTGALTAVIHGTWEGETLVLQVSPVGSPPNAIDEGEITLNIGQAGFASGDYWLAGTVSDGAYDWLPAEAGGTGSCVQVVARHVASPAAHSMATPN